MTRNTSNTVLFGRIADIFIRNTAISFYNIETVLNLLQRNKSGGVGSTDTGSTVLDGFVGHREFSQVVTDHLWLDFDRGKGLSVVDAADGAGHLGDDDHVSEMGLDGVGLLVGGGFLLLPAELLNEGEMLPLAAALELAANAAGEEFDELFVVHVQQLVEVDAAVREFTEGTLLPLLTLKQKKNCL